MRITIVAVLFLALVCQLIPYAEQGPSFSVMPIFTPVSLQYEKQIRQGQAPLNIRQAMGILEDLERTPTSSVSVEDLRSLKENRSKILDLRNERHTLNVEMMRLSIEIVRELEPEQWEIIQSQRDAIQSKVEMEAFDRLLQRYSGD